MKYVAGYILAQLGGHEPTAKDIDKIFASVGLDFDAQRADTVVNALKGKVLEDVIADGSKKLAQFGSGGGAPVAAAAPAASGGAAAAKEEPKKEEKKPEKEEESDEDMGFGLFD